MTVPRGTGSKRDWTTVAGAMPAVVDTGERPVAIPAGKALDPARLMDWMLQRLHRGPGK